LAANQIAVSRSGSGGKSIQHHCAERQRRWRKKAEQEFGQLESFDDKTIATVGTRRCFPPLYQAQTYEIIGRVFDGQRTRNFPPNVQGRIALSPRQTKTSGFSRSRPRTRDDRKRSEKIRFAVIQADRISVTSPAKSFRKTFHIFSNNNFRQIDN